MTPMEAALLTLSIIVYLGASFFLSFTYQDITWKDHYMGPFGRFVLAFVIMILFGVCLQLVGYVGEFLMLPFKYLFKLVF
jgi:phosphoglycerol transferase MdoB-like AlkP superfamily enzyme